MTRLNRLVLALALLACSCLAPSLTWAEVEGTPINQLGSSFKQFISGSKVNKPKAKPTATDSLLSGNDSTKPAAAPEPPTRSTQLELPAPDFEDIPELQATMDNPLMPKMKRVDAPDNKLGLNYAGSQLMAVEKLIDQKKWVEASAKLAPLKTWLIDATEMHIELYQLLGKVPSGRLQAQFEKRLALEFAKMRDLALMDSASIKLATGKEKEALSELMSVVRSQSRTPMGQEAYRLMQDVGFTEALEITPAAK